MLNEEGTCALWITPYCVWPFALPSPHPVWVAAGSTGPQRRRNFYVELLCPKQGLHTGVLSVILLRCYRTNLYLLLLHGIFHFSCSWPALERDLHFGFSQTEEGERECLKATRSWWVIKVKENALILGRTQYQSAPIFFPLLSANDREGVALTTEGNHWSKIRVSVISFLPITAFLDNSDLNFPSLHPSMF